MISIGNDGLLIKTSAEKGLECSFKLETLMMKSLNVNKYNLLPTKDD